MSTNECLGKQPTIPDEITELINQSSLPCEFHSNYRKYMNRTLRTKDLGVALYQRNIRAFKRHNLPMRKKLTEAEASERNRINTNNWKKQNPEQTRKHSVVGRQKSKEEKQRLRKQLDGLAHENNQLRSKLTAVTSKVEDLSTVKEDVQKLHATIAELTRNISPIYLGEKPLCSTPDDTTNARTTELPVSKSPKRRRDQDTSVVEERKSPKLESAPIIRN